MAYGKSLIALAVALIALTVSAPAHADARITGLADVSFGTISAIADQSNSQNISVCSYQGRSTAGYSVRATGSGGGGAFLLSSGAGSLPYEVAWADAANQTGGFQLQANVLSSGHGGAAGRFACLFQLDTASLTVTIRATELASAAAGTYSGILSITIVPE